MVRQPTGMVMEHRLTNRCTGRREPKAPRRADIVSLTVHRIGRERQDNDAGELKPRWATADH